jgi:hypothetical protein
MKNTSCDSAELAAIRAHGFDKEALERYAAALLRMVDELNKQIAAERKLRASLLPSVEATPYVAETIAKLMSDRDELRAKLAEAEQENVEVCKANENLLNDWERELKSAEAAEARERARLDDVTLGNHSTPEAAAERIERRCAWACAAGHSAVPQRGIADWETADTLDREWMRAAVASLDEEGAPR